MLAKYRGKCIRCGNFFHPGTEIEFDSSSSGWFEVTCEGTDQGSSREEAIQAAELSEIGHKPNGVCNSCFLVHAGECL